MSGAWGLFAYDALDYTAAQQWLDRKAAQGWRLKKLYFGLLAGLSGTKPSVILCCVAPQGYVQGEEADSCRLCAGTGLGLGGRGAGHGPLCIPAGGVSPAVSE